MNCFIFSIQKLQLVIDVIFRTVMFQLTAPNAICGRVIGRGGSKINSITVCNCFSSSFLFRTLTFTNLSKCHLSKALAEKSSEP